MTITGYTDAAGTVVSTLADLKKVNPVLATEVTELISQNVSVLTVPASGAMAGVLQN